MLLLASLGVQESRAGFQPPTRLFRLSLLCLVPLWGKAILTHHKLVPILPRHRRAPLVRCMLVAHESSSHRHDVGLAGRTLVARESNIEFLFGLGLVHECLPNLPLFALCCGRQWGRRDLCGHSSALLR